ncbi:hypothetical protein PHYBOEH_002909 [Phytophthora boehmeriae]|uniref:Uncharacterized protein n=1 Tax=Phytophthora boehmeriae TaxID=109152 RepID=A0A8T1WVY0_9STRA|nr:hypothetical protein PHYBOEH_002909 [Phytophthora boehmeriae]
MKNVPESTSVLDAFGLEEIPKTPPHVVDPKRKNKKSTRTKVTTIIPNSEAFRLAELKTQDPAVFAHILADHFVAREHMENSAAATTRPSPLPSSLPVRQKIARPAAGTANLGSFRSWQFGERCLATYRVLFGRPLWAASTPTSLPQYSPRPRKRKHVTPPTSSSSDSSETSNADLDAFELEPDATGDLLNLPMVDELLELQGEEVLAIGGKEDTHEDSFETEDMLAGLAMELNDGVDADTDIGGEAVDLWWGLDATGIDGVDSDSLLTEREEEELRFMTASASFTPDTSDLNDMETI